MLSKNANFSFLGHFRPFYGILDRLILKISQLTLRVLGATAPRGSLRRHRRRWGLGGVARKKTIFFLKKGGYGAIWVLFQVFSSFYSETFF
jgi:hypothetical protein